MPDFGVGPIRRQLFPPIAALAVSAVVVAGCGGATGTATQTQKPAGVAGKSEIALQPVSKKTANPFTSPVGKDKSGVKPPSKAVSPSGGVASYSGNLPGLYGGTLNYATCNAKQLISFLESDNAKALAWSRTLGIGVSDIRSYVSHLTPVILRTDTRVTNHGYVNGVANPIQAVLQAGTAVFVNSYGQPVVKCYCGNPLTAPIAAAAPVYTGPQWVSFSTTHITIIEKSITVIHVFKLYDPRTRTIFERPAGTDGTSDAPPAGSQPTTPTTPAPTQPPPQQPPTTTQAPSAPTESPSASWSPNPGHLGDNFTLSVSGFAPNTQLVFELLRPDGVLERYSINTDSSGHGSYTFTGTGTAISGTYTATVTNPNTGAHVSSAVQVQPA